MEEFKDIPWYEGKYQASNLGFIKSLLNKKILSAYQHSNKYLTVQLCYDWQIKRHLVHRLVALTFLINTEERKTVNHKNWIRDDNRLENLEWNTYSENLKHKYQSLWYKGAFNWKFWKDNPSSKRFAQYTLEWVLIKEWHWVYNIWKELWITPSWITAVCRWVRKTAWGFIWKYLD